MIRIEHYDSILNTPALKLAVAGWNELLQADLAGPSACLICWDHKAIVAFDYDDEPVGCLTWLDQNWANRLWINLSYVIPERRRKGIHRMMFAELVKKAHELKRPVIGSSVSKKNTASRASMAAQGRIETSVMVQFEVPSS